MTMHVAETDILPCLGQVWRVGEGFRLWQETCCDDFVLMINDISLAVFNLIPFPPLDGSKMVSSMLDYNQARKFEELQRFSFLFIFILILTPVLGYIMAPAIWVSNVLINIFIHLLA